MLYDYERLSAFKLPNDSGVVMRHVVSLAAAVDHLMGQVDELVVLNLQHTLLLPARGQVGIITIDKRPLTARVVVEVKILNRVIL